MDNNNNYYFTYNPLTQMEYSKNRVLNKIPKHFKNKEPERLQQLLTNQLLSLGSSTFFIGYGELIFGKEKNRYNVFATSEYPNALIRNAITGTFMLGKVGIAKDEHQYFKVRVATGIPLGNQNFSKTLFFENEKEYKEFFKIEDGKEKKKINYQKNNNFQKR